MDFLFILCSVVIVKISPQNHRCSVCESSAVVFVRKMLFMEWLERKEKECWMTDDDWVVCLQKSPSTWNFCQFMPFTNKAERNFCCWKFSWKLFNRRKLFGFKRKIGFKCQLSNESSCLTSLSSLFHRCWYLWIIYECYHGNRKAFASFMKCYKKNSRGWKARNADKWRGEIDLLHVECERDTHRKRKASECNENFMNAPREFTIQLHKEKCEFRWKIRDQRIVRARKINFLKCHEKILSKTW